MAHCNPLNINSGICKILILGILAIVFVHFGFFEVLQHVLIYQSETWYVHLIADTTDRVRVSFQSGHFDLLYSQK